MFLLILGLVILGPEKLPTVLRKMGRFYGEFKRMTNDAQSDFRQAFAEPLRDLQSAASEYKSVFQDAAGEIADDSLSQILSLGNHPRRLRTILIQNRFRTKQHRSIRYLLTMTHKFPLSRTRIRTNGDQMAAVYNRSRWGINEHH